MSAEGTWESHTGQLSPSSVKEGGCCPSSIDPLKNSARQALHKETPKARLQALPCPVNYQSVITSHLPDLYCSDSNKAVTIFLEQPREDVPSPDSLLIPSTLPCSFFFFLTLIEILLDLDNVLIKTTYLH